MLDKKISVSEQVDNLSIEAKLIYTWSIPHTDDLGLLPYSHKTLKALIIPMRDIKLDTFGNQVEEILKQGLYKIFEYNNEKFYRVVNFFKHQTLKRDRQPQTFINFKYSKNPKDSWDKIIKECGFHLEDNGNHLDTEEKRREEKRSKEKIINYSQKSLELSKLLYKLIKKNNPSWYVKPNLDKWAEDMDKINRLDKDPITGAKRTFEQIEWMIEWSQKDDFWSQNILSPAKLRKQFNQMVVKAKKTKSGGITII